MNPEELIEKYRHLADFHLTPEILTYPQGILGLLTPRPGGV